jgi:hypothetical protein
MDRAMVVVVVVPMLMWEVLVCGRNVWGAKALDVFASRISSRLAAAMEAILVLVSTFIISCYSCCVVVAI